MCHPDSEFDYEEKLARVGIEIEMLILDLIHDAVERLNLRPNNPRAKSNTAEDLLPF